MKNVFLCIVTMMVIGFMAGCGTVKVQRVDISKTIDLSGRWNDSDARMVSQEMIANCLKSAWLDEFYKKHGQNPVVIVGTVVNKTSEHINSDVFVKSLEESLLSSGKVVFVASKNERLEVREERKGQNEEGWTDPETIKPIGKETGADFMLKGAINSVTDELKGKQTTLYQVTLELVDMTTNRVTWLGKTELKKLVSRARLSL